MTKWNPLDRFFVVIIQQIQNYFFVVSTVKSGLLRINQWWWKCWGRNWDAHLSSNQNPSCWVKTDGIQWLWQTTRKDPSKATQKLSLTVTRVFLSLLTCLHELHQLVATCWKLWGDWPSFFWCLLKQSKIPTKNSQNFKFPKNIIIAAWFIRIIRNVYQSAFEVSSTKTSENRAAARVAQKFYSKLFERALRNEQDRNLIQREGWSSRPLSPLRIGLCLPLPNGLLLHGL